MIRTILMTALALVLAPIGLHAQQTSPDDCERAREFVTTTQPRDSLPIAFMLLDGCSTDYRVNSVRAAVDAQRGSTEEDVVRSLWGSFRRTIDGRIWAIAESIAEDPAASPISRMRALLTLVSFAWPEVPMSESNLRGGACTHFSTRHEWSFGSQPIPVDAQSRVIQLAARLRADDALPPDVRTALRCVPESNGPATAEVVGQ